MTIPATSRRSPVYVGNGVATAYAFSFKVLAGSESTVLVTVADADDLNPVELTYGIDYTVTLNPDQDAAPGGEVNYTGLAVGHRLVITTETPYSQTTSIRNQGAFYPGVLEDALDRVVIQVQQLADDVGRTVKLPPTSEGDPSQILQDSIYLAANSAAAAAASASAASTSETNAANSASAAATSATNASNSASNAASSASSAATSATDASNSASAAATSATNASNSASAAATSATNAGNSATAAAGSASSAATQATNASNSASAAATSASSAATSATSASNSAAAAAASAASIDPATLVKRDGSQAMTGPLPVTAGTAASPGLTFVGDPDTGVYRSADNEVAVAAGGSRVATVNSDGSLNLYGNVWRLKGENATHVFEMGPGVGSGNADRIGYLVPGGRRHDFYTASSLYLSLQGDTGQVHVMPESNGPSFRVGNPDAGFVAAAVTVKYLGSGTQNGIALRPVTNGGTALNFGNAAGSSVGSISCSASATTYSTSSDYRLKQDVAPLGDALTRLSALRPVRFAFKVDPTVRVDGFLAHEVQEVVPEAVVGEKDGDTMQGLDHSKLVPLLVAAVQELAARVAQLEGRA